MKLDTPRLILRELVYEDWNRVFAYQSDPLHLRFYDSTYRTTEDVQVLIRTFLEWQQEVPRRKYQLAIDLRHNGLLIGNCGIRIDDHIQRQANIGYELDSQYWGHGYATEAARVLLSFGFEQLGLHRIWAWCIADNVASARVLERIGMRLEGRERRKERIRGRWYDALTYAILDDDWQAGKRL